AGCQLPVTGCRLPVTGYQLPVTGCQSSMIISNLKPQTSNLRSQISKWETKTKLNNKPKLEIVNPQSPPGTWESIHDA
ncbi:MAG: hypothetical protein ACE5EC_08295, partial [Phycisphaerae bacterium]